jgi:hypothetical protein
MKRTPFFFPGVALAWLFLFTHSIHAQNPLITHIYAADPSAHVWPTDPDTLYVYTSHDIPGTNHHATMAGYHVFSTQDLVNWIDHGRVLGVEQVPWASTHAWAIDATYWKGRYYLITCMKSREDGLFNTGLAVSDRPEGPFTDIGYIEGIENGQDPALFIDNGIPYLFWGYGNRCFGVQLTDDLRAAIPETYVDLTPQLFEVFEGPWVHKYQGKYYLTYPALSGGEWPEEMYYATADHPLGPYTFQSNFIPFFKAGASTNHGSVLKFKDQWMAFHHSAILSGGNSYNRNVEATFLFYNEDGSIQTIDPWKNQITGGKKPRCVIKLEAENGEAAGGRLSGVVRKHSRVGFSGAAYVTGFEGLEDDARVLAQVSHDGAWDLTLRYAADKDARIAVLVNEVMLNGDYSTWKSMVLPASSAWTDSHPMRIQLRAGDNFIRINTEGRDSLDLDYFLLEPVE